MTGSIDHPAVRRDVPLAAHTTYKVGGLAAFWAEPATIADLAGVLDAVPSDLPVLVLGRGSNLVFSDAGFDGLVIRPTGEFLGVSVGDDGEVVAGGAAPLPKVARTAAAAGRAGLEFYVGIPGSVGGAIRMNAGGHGSDTATVLLTATVLDLVTRQTDDLTPAALEFGYRRSGLTDRHMVLRASFRTEPGDPAVLDGRLRDIIRWRKEHQPGGTLNAGSVFKNPPGASAGEIIDRLGLKGYRRGDVAVSEMHANFFVAGPGATGHDIWELVRAVRAKVKEATGIDLEPEIRFVGQFGDTEVHP